MSPGSRAWRRFLLNRQALVSLGALGVLLLLIVFARAWWRIDPSTLSDAQLEGPTAGHWFGTDANGRDVLARVLAGARVSLSVGIAGALISLLIGVTWGATAGYLGGRIDEFLMRIVDIFYSLPAVICIIVLITTLQDRIKVWLERLGGPAAAESTPLVLLIVGLGGISWLTMARIVRGQVRSLRESPFIEASRVLGASHWRVILRHILPNTTGVIIAYLTLTVPTVVLAESFLSYLGLGIQPPQASLGSLIADGAGQINPLHSYWWLLGGPGVILVALLICLSFVGDGLRDALDPESHLPVR